MADGRLTRWLLPLGGAASLLTGLWWWLVFRQVIGSGSMSYADALPCIAADSDLCSLAEALCTQDHFLGIRTYDTAGFWLSIVLLVAGLAFGRRVTARPDQTP